MYRFQIFHRLYHRRTMLVNSLFPSFLRIYHYVTQFCRQNEFNSRDTTWRFHYENNQDSNFRFTSGKRNLVILISGFQ